MHTADSLAESAGIASLYTSALRDNDLRVRVMALKASCALVAFLSRTKHVMLFQSVVPLMYDVVAECADPAIGENTAAALGLECFVDLALSPAPVLKGQVGSLARFALAIGRNTRIDIMLRDAALQVVVVLVESKPRTMVKAAGGAQSPGSPGMPGSPGSGTYSLSGDFANRLWPCCNLPRRRYFSPLPFPSLRSTSC